MFTKISIATFFAKDDRQKSEYRILISKGIIFTDACIQFFNLDFCQETDFVKKKNCRKWSLWIRSGCWKERWGVPPTMDGADFCCVAWNMADILNLLLYSPVAWTLTSPPNVLWELFFRSDLSCPQSGVDFCCVTWNLADILDLLIFSSVAWILNLSSHHSLRALLKKSLHSCPPRVESEERSLLFALQLHTTSSQWTQHNM